MFEAMVVLPDMVMLMGFRDAEAEDAEAFVVLFVVDATLNAALDAARDDVDLVLLLLTFAFTLAVLFPMALALALKEEDPLPLPLAPPRSVSSRPLFDVDLAFQSDGWVMTSGTVMSVTGEMPYVN